MGEIAFLTLNKRSCLVRVHNATCYTINNNPIAIYGEIDGSHCGPIDIFSQKTESYLFKKTTVSLVGCAGIQMFDVEGSNISFVIAFRNYTIQLRKRSRNKVAILRINNNDLEDVDLRDFFRNIMEHEGPGHPTFNGCYISDAERIFTAALASESSAIRIKFDDIKIDVKMSIYFDSLIEVTVSTIEAPMRQPLREDTSHETCSNASIKESIYLSTVELPHESRIAERPQDSEGVKEISVCSII